MPSYQAIDTDLRTVEAKVDFIMKSIRLSRPSPIVGAPPTTVSMLDLFTESRRAGLEIVDPPAAPTGEEVGPTNG